MDKAAALSFIVDELVKPYVLGKSDCFLMACRHVDAVRGTDLFWSYVGKYRTIRGAHRVMVEDGCKSLTEWWEQHLDLIPPAQARFGDVAIIKSGVVEHCGICVGDFVTKTDVGQKHHSLSDVISAFRV